MHCSLCVCKDSSAGNRTFIIQQANGLLVILSFYPIYHTVEVLIGISQQIKEGYIRVHGTTHTATRHSNSDDSQQ